MPFRQREPNLTEPRHAPCLRPSGHDPRLSNAALWPTLMLRIGAFRALIGSVNWVLEQFQRLMAVLVRVRLWDRISLPTKHTKIGHFSVLHENTLRAAHAIFLLHRHDCAISRIGF